MSEPETPTRSLECPECGGCPVPCDCGQSYRYFLPDASASIIWAVLRYRSPAERRDIIQRALDGLAKCGSSQPNPGAPSTDAGDSRSNR